MTWLMLNLRLYLIKTYVIYIKSTVVFNQRQFDLC